MKNKTILGQNINNLVLLCEITKGSREFDHPTATLLVATAQQGLFGSSESVVASKANSVRNLSANRFSGRHSAVSITSQMDGNNSGYGPYAQRLEFHADDIRGVVDFAKVAKTRKERYIPASRGRHRAVYQPDTGTG